MVKMWSRGHGTSEAPSQVVKLETCAHNGHDNCQLRARLSHLASASCYDEQSLRYHVNEIHIVCMQLNFIGWGVRADGALSCALHAYP